jgi:hypothetical protein
MVTPNWLIAVILTFLAAVYALLNLIFPLMVMKLIMHLTKLMLKEFNPTIDQPGSFISLLENNPDEFKRKYRYKILLTRIGGGFMFLVSSFALFLIILDVMV